MYLITGGTGLLGSFLLLRLCREGKSVKALKKADSSTVITKRIFNYYDDGAELFNKIQWHEGNILDYSSLLHALDGIQTVFHCAGMVSYDKKDHDLLYTTNVEGTKLLVNACLEKKTEYLCHVSSIAALGNEKNKDQQIDEQSHLDPTSHFSVYSKSKYEGEKEVWRGMAEGLKACIVNPGIIIGMGDPTKGSSQLISFISKISSFYPIGTNAFIDVRDTADIMYLLSQQKITGHRFVLVEGNYTYKEIFSKMAYHLNKREPRIKVFPALMEVAWRLEKLKSLIGVKGNGLTKENVRASYRENYYSGKK